MINVLDKLTQHAHWLVLTGAGVSAQSGVPTYRDRRGVWQRKPPVKHQEFIQQHAARQRFWSRNMVGWRFMSSALPNAAHTSLADLEAIGHVGCLVTQNVDGLHQRAGSQNVIDSAWARRHRNLLILSPEVSPPPTTAMAREE